MSLGDAACDGQADAEAAGLGAAGGVGIDSNGDLNVSGGEIYVSGPTSDGDSALDYDGAATVTGGTIVAAGYSGMAQNFGSDSTQGSTCTVTIGGQSTDARSSASSTAAAAWARHLMATTAAIWARPRTAAKAAARVINQHCFSLQNRERHAPARNAQGRADNCPVYGTVHLLSYR